MKVLSVKVIFCWTFLSVGLFSLSQNVDAQPELKMTCNVTGQEIVEVLEGKYRSFDHLNDGFMVGDTVNLTISAGSNANQFSFNLLGFRPLRGCFIYGNEQSEIVRTAQGGLKLILTDSDSANHDIRRAMLLINPDYIYMKNACGDDLTLHRYYKNDWHGMGQDDPFTGRDFHLVKRVFGLNCRETLQSMSDLLSNTR